MTPRRLVVVVNPRGGKRRGLTILDRVKPVFMADSMTPPRPPVPMKRMPTVAATASVPPTVVAPGRLARDKARGSATGFAAGGVQPAAMAAVSGQ